MTFAYADPPYLGMCSAYGHDHGDDGRCWNDRSTHAALIDRLERDYPAGWCVSCTSRDLRWLLPLCPDSARVCAWTKTFHAIRPGVYPSYAWEPVILAGGRRQRVADGMTVRDWFSSPRAQQRGTFGAKPPAFAAWVELLLGARPDDTVVDLFAGSGTCARQFAQGRLV